MCVNTHLSSSVLQVLSDCSDSDSRLSLKGFPLSEANKGFMVAAFSQEVQCRSKGNKSGGGARERRRREPLGGSGGILPQKILKSRGLEMLFRAFSKSYL